MKIVDEIVLAINPKCRLNTTIGGRPTPNFMSNNTIESIINAKLEPVKTALEMCRDDDDCQHGFGMGLSDDVRKAVDAGIALFEDS